MPEITVREAAKRLGVSETTAMKYIRDGLVHARREQREGRQDFRYMVDADALTAFIAAHGETLDKRRKHAPVPFNGEAKSKKQSRQVDPVAGTDEVLNHLRVTMRVNEPMRQIERLENELARVKHDRDRALEEVEILQRIIMTLGRAL